MYLFDFDGTLLESNQIWLEIDEAFLQARGVSPVPQDYTDFVTHHGFPEGAVYTKNRFQLEESPEEIVACWQEMGRVAYGEHLPLKAGAKALLERLHGQGENIVLLTSCIPELCQLALNRHDIKQYFTHVFTAVELGMEKRNPEIYRHVAALCGVEPEEVTFFDDAPTYCQAAKSAGMRVVGVWDELYAHRAGEMEGICHRYLTTLSQF